MNVIRQPHLNPFRWKVTVDRNGVLIERGKWFGWALFSLVLGLAALGMWG